MEAGETHFRSTSGRQHQHSSLTHPPATIRFIPLLRQEAPVVPPIATKLSEVPSVGVKHDFDVLRPVLLVEFSRFSFIPPEDAHRLAVRDSFVVLQILVQVYSKPMN